MPLFVPSRVDSWLTVAPSAPTDSSSRIRAGWPRARSWSVSVTSSRSGRGRRIKRQERLTLCQGPDQNRRSWRPPNPTLPEPAPADVAARCADLVAERFLLPELGTGRHPAAPSRRRGRLRRPRPGIPGRRAQRRPPRTSRTTCTCASSTTPAGCRPPRTRRRTRRTGARPPARRPAGCGGSSDSPATWAVLSVGPVLTPPTPSRDAVSAALALVADADALVLDVRECRGGRPRQVQRAGERPRRRRAGAPGRSGRAPRGCASAGRTRWRPGGSARTGRWWC